MRNGRVRGGGPGVLFLVSLEASTFLMWLFYDVLMPSLYFVVLFSLLGWSLGLPLKNALASTQLYMLIFSSNFHNSKATVAFSSSPMDLEVYLR